jgi:hypothetical protein
MRNSNSERGSDSDTEWVDGLSIDFDEENGTVTLDWEDDSPYAELCRDIEKDNSLFVQLLESYLKSLKADE